MIFPTQALNPAAGGRRLSPRPECRKSTQRPPPAARKTVAPHDWAGYRNRFSSGSNPKHLTLNGAALVGPPPRADFNDLAVQERLDQNSELGARPGQPGPALPCPVLSLPCPSCLRTSRTILKERRKPWNEFRAKL